MAATPTRCRSPSRPPPFSVNTTIGGKGGTGGNAGVVTLNNDKGLIEDHGDDAIAVFAQSIGGGGGNGGASSSRDINLIGTEKNFSASFNMAIGGSGGAGGTGRRGHHQQHWRLDPHHFLQPKGVVAQSIGGGGGWGGGAAAAGSGASAAKFTADVSLGGGGGGGGAGGIITLVNDGTIYTTGSNSAAIYAQSVGGGGGMGGSAATDSSTDGNVQVANYLAGPHRLERRRDPDRRRALEYPGAVRRRLCPHQFAEGNQQGLRRSASRPGSPPGRARRPATSP